MFAKEIQSLENIMQILNWTNQCWLFMTVRYIFLFTIFSKNFGERGGGDAWVGGEKNFPDIQKRGLKNFSAHKPVKFRVKNFFPYKFLLKHA